MVAFCERILALGRGNLQLSRCKCPGVPWGQPPGMAADKGSLLEHERLLGQIHLHQHPE